MDKEYWKLKKREQREKAKALKKEVVVVIPAVLGKGLKVEAEWDEEKYPDRVMWENAVGRAERATRYAKMFPERTRPSDLKYQDVDYQYREETRIREKGPVDEPKREVTDLKLIEQRCDKCNGFWSASIILVCPYCDGTGVRKPVTR